MSKGTRDGQDALTEAGLAALRGFVGVAGQSLTAAGGTVTLPQFRALMAVAVEGPVPSSTLAGLIGVAPSTATRMCDRLVRDKLLARRTAPGDRRIVTVSLTAKGTRLLDRVVEWRRVELARRFASIDEGRREQVTEALETCAAALGGSVPALGGWA